MEEVTQVTLDLHNPNRKSRDSFWDLSRVLVGPIDVPDGWWPLPSVRYPHPTHPKMVEEYKWVGWERASGRVRYEFRTMRLRREGDPVRL